MCTTNEYEKLTCQTSREKSSPFTFFIFHNNKWTEYNMNRHRTINTGASIKQSFLFWTRLQVLVFRNRLLLAGGLYCGESVWYHPRELMRNVSFHSTKHADKIKPILVLLSLWLCQSFGHQYYYFFYCCFVWSSHARCNFSGIRLLIKWLLSNLFRQVTSIVEGHKDFYYYSYHKFEGVSVRSLFIAKPIVIKFWSVYRIITDRLWKRM